MPLRSGEVDAGRSNERMGGKKGRKREREREQTFSNFTGRCRRHVLAGLFGLSSYSGTPLLTTTQRASLRIRTPRRRVTGTRWIPSRCYHCLAASGVPYRQWLLRVHPAISARTQRASSSAARRHAPFLQHRMVRLPFPSWPITGSLFDGSVQREGRAGSTEK